MIVKCKECGTSIEVDESQYENSSRATTICPLCGEEVSFSIKKEEKKDENFEKRIIYDTNDSDISFCSKCGKKLRKDEVFCPHCGNRVTSNPTPPSHRPLPPTPVMSSKKEDSRSKTERDNRILSTHTVNRSSNKSSIIMLIIILAVIGSGIAVWFFVNTFDNKGNIQEDNVNEEIPQERVIYQSNVNTKNCFIVISKKSLSLKVYEGSNTDTTLVAVFPACLSRNKGQKHTAGDNRTPECSMDNPFRINQITDASTWRYDFGDGRGSILAYGNWFIRLNSEFSGIGIMGSTNNEQSVPGRESSGSVRLRDNDLDYLKEHYVFEGMKVVIKSEDEGLYNFEKRCLQKI